MLKKLLLLGTTLFTIISIFSCEDNPVEPEAKPGRRDYAWHADTIKAPFFFIDRIWGCSPENVWAVGSGGALSTTIWHYDGNKWETDNISRSIAPWCIWGTDKNNVWIGGGESKIWQFDGNIWSESIKFDVSNGTGVTFGDIWGTSKNNIYAVGSSGYGENRIATIAHFNGKEWSLLEFSEFKYHLGIIRYGKNTNQNYYLIGHGDSSIGLFKFDGIKLEQVINNGFGQNDLVMVEEIDNELYFAFDGKLQKLKNGNFIHLLSYDSYKFAGRIYGRNEKDIIFLYRDGLLHYNGSNMEYIRRFENNFKSDMEILQNDIFVLSADLQTDINIIRRGRLN